MANAAGQDSEQQRGLEGEVDVGCKGSEEGSGGVSEQEQGAGYVDIPRRIAWERLGSGRKNHALQVGPTYGQRACTMQQVLRIVVTSVCCLRNRQKCNGSCMTHAQRFSHVH